ncbi:hypothetical protein KQ945_16985, partial [Bacillus subtilis subsp. subtilis]|nr:hypothetical protein [Bacillus subtilis subsp. subtilis]
MPKPLFLARSTGLYARFLIPLDLQARLGRRFIVRALRLPPGDGARLAAARMGMALSDMFKSIRTGRYVDKKELDELLRKAASGELFELTLEGVELPNGTRVGRAQIDTPQDAQLFAEAFGLQRPFADSDKEHLVRVNRRREQVRQASIRIQPGIHEVTTPTRSPLSGVPRRERLSGSIALHLRDLARRKRLRKDTVTESRHTLRILLGLVGDMPASALNVHHARSLMEAVEHWPKHATQKDRYRLLGVKEIVRASKENQEPRPALR